MTIRQIQTGLFALLVLAATACSKNDDIIPPTEPNTQDPVQNPQEADEYRVFAQAVISIGGIVYDSIPADIEVVSWDNNNVAFRRTVSLKPGKNILDLPKSHNRYEVSINKWGVTDRIAFTKDEIAEGTTLSLGGSRAAKRLQREESYLFASGAYQLNNRAEYTYTAEGKLAQADYHQKKVQSPDLVLTIRDYYQYSGGVLEEIRRMDGADKQTGFTRFTYSPQGKLTNMHQKSFDQDTWAAVEYRYEGATQKILIDYLFDNGNAMEYEMSFRKGNLVEDRAVSSRGGSENGTYAHDTHINPYLHMGVQNIFLSHLSRNNAIQKNKNYSGSIPSSVPKKFEYTYDADGYPTELVTHYYSYQTGEFLFKIKTLYFYQ